MKRAKCTARSVLFIIALFASFIVPSGIANATSDYDDLLRSTPSLYVYTDGSTKTQKMDISSTWWTNFKQSYAKRVAQNIGWPADFVAKFEDIMESGGSWGVFLQEDSYGNTITIAGTQDPHAHCGFVGSAISGTYECTSSPGYGFVHAGYFTHNSYGGNGCLGSYGDRCSDNGMNIYSSPTIVTGTAGYTFISLPTASLPTFKFFSMNFDLAYPAGYNGVLIPTEPPSAKLVAMGDSFSSGEGNPLFEVGTNQDGVNECHRSFQAYPRLLQADLDFESTAFVACSGATTNDILGIAEDDDPKGKWNEPTQIDALTSSTEIVTITIGGNDVGFGDFAYACLFPIGGVCDEFTNIYDDTVWKISNELPDKLENVYSTILNEAENADIYVLGYPQIAPYKSISDPFDQDCGGLYDEFPNNWGDARAAHAITELLNGAVEDAVETVNNRYLSNRLTFVPVSGGAFTGHDACSSDSYFNGIVLPDTEYSVHPNADGQLAYKGDLVDAMS